jgi:hypothetical protein
LGGAAKSACWNQFARLNKLAQIKKADSHLPFLTTIGKRVDYSTAFTILDKNILVRPAASKWLIYIVLA